MSKNTIFVFSSNVQGRHGAGSAKHAREVFGAVYGVGKGRTGNAYAIPTRSESSLTGKKLWTLPLYEIERSVKEFIQYANEHKELTFEITKIGCGLAGFNESQIIPMFKNIPDNCILPEGWNDYVKK
jgi:hypothetical protein